MNRRAIIECPCRGKVETREFLIMREFLITGLVSSTGLRDPIE
jgi:hypothetical protein